MNYLKTSIAAFALIGLAACGGSTEKSTDAEKTKTTNTEKEMSVYNVPVKYLNGETLNWNDYKGKRIMFVNVASECGLTPQYEQLQAMYNELDKEKYAFIGVPANNFLEQEPGEASDIATFCKKNYGVDFPILEKMSVSDNVYLSYPASAENAKKTETSPLYDYLTSKEKNNAMDIDMTWNFQKIFVDENGKVYDYAAPREIEATVLLGKLAI